MKEEKRRKLAELEADAEHWDRKGFDLGDQLGPPSGSSSASRSALSGLASRSSRCASTKRGM